MSGVTPSQTVGPFFHAGLTTNTALGRLYSETTVGERIQLRIRLFDGDGIAIPDGMIELWQADAAGNYNRGDTEFGGFGRLPTNTEGDCTFETIRPGRTPDGRGNLQASHINVSVFARGLLSRLSTRVYFADDTALAEDPVLSIVPEERRSTLMARQDQEPGDWIFDIYLQGEKETVFFDI